MSGALAERKDWRRPRHGCAGAQSGVQSLAGIPGPLARSIPSAAIAPERIGMFAVMTLPGADSRYEVVPQTVPVTVETTVGSVGTPVLTRMLNGPDPCNVVEPLRPTPWESMLTAFAPSTSRIAT